MADYLSVSSLTKYLKLKFDCDPYLERVYLTGQVSNFRKRPTHQYFSLKDENAVIQATMWAGVFRKLGFDLEEGMKINVVGRVQLYAPNGTYSIVIERAEPDGIGALAVQFEQLKKKLTQAGYFAAEHKQALPQFVKKIGVITSPSGAVIRDIITTIRRRFPGVAVLLFPTKVQGEGSAQEVADNIAKANQREDLDLLIVGRGGGSIEDLWAFNEEIVVQAIFESRLPVISSVGHETDTTLADYVADHRAATPTAAAELATPVTKADVLSWLQEASHRAYQAVQRRIKQQEDRFLQVSRSVIFRQPERLYDAHSQKLDRLREQLFNLTRSYLRQNQQEQLLLAHRLNSLDLRGQLERFQDRLNQQERLLKSNMANQYDSKLARFEKAQEALLSLDTSRIVARGYAIVQKNGRPITSVKEAAIGMALNLEMKDGELEVEVKNAKQKEDI
ncbi:exodeoxyribonuclease VII large subunit [Streptococcus dentasini]